MNLRLFALASVALAAVTAPGTVAAPAAAAPVRADSAKPVPVSVLAKSVDIPYSSFTLANGLRVIVHTDRKAPIVAVSVWYNVGSKFEPAGQTGFAHLFEHLMFYGSENSPTDFFTPLKVVGATDYNGTTYFDRTNYFETVPTPALDRALFLESDRMGYLLGAVTQGVLDQQRGVVQNEKRQDDNQPFGLVRYKKTEALFPATHPYGHTTIGSMADLDKASLGDVKNWFRGHYGPNNAVLVLAGDIDAATAKEKVEKYFGGIPRGPASIAPPAGVPTLPAPKSEVIRDNVATTRLYRMWAVPGLNDKASVALDVFAGVLGGLSSSRLDNDLVRGEKIAVRVSAYNESFSQVGVFEVQADVRPGVDPALVAKRLDADIAELIARGPTRDEVRRVATSSVSSTIAGLESVGGFNGKAVTLASGELYSNDPAYYKKQLAMLAAQTPESVRAAAAKWLSRPVYALTVEPGAREVYAESAPPPVPAPDTTPRVKGTRGALPAVGAIADLVFPAVRRTRLKNGIELIYARRTAVPITQAVISFNAGVAADPADKLGTQGLTLSAMDEGTPTRTSIQIAEQKERLGASIGGGATADRTRLSLFTPSPNLAPALDLFADIVRNPAFPAVEVDRVKNQQRARIAAELSDPDSLAGRLMPRLVYGPTSPYAKSFGSGDPRAIAALTRDDLIAFQHAWLRPDKAQIFVVSDRPLAEITAAFDARFGDWAPVGAAGVKDLSAASIPSPAKIVLIDRPDSPQSVIYGAVPTSLKGTDDLLPVLTANDSLGGDALSRINADLRETRHWSYGSFSYFDRAEGATPFIISAPVQADKTGASVASIQRDLKEFLTTRGITPAEFDRSITGQIRSLSGNFETAVAVLGAMQRNDLYQRPDDFYATLPRQYRALTLPQLDAAMRAAIDPARAIWVVVGDAKNVRPQLDSLGLPVEVVPASSVADAH